MIVREAIHVELVDERLRAARMVRPMRSGAHTDVLPRLFDRERGLRLVRRMIGSRAAPRSRAKRRRRKAVHDRIRAERACRILLDEVVGDRRAEAIGAAFGIEPQQDARGSDRFRRAKVCGLNRVFRGVRSLACPIELSTAIYVIFL